MGWVMESSLLYAKQKWKSQKYQKKVICKKMKMHWPHFGVGHKFCVSFDLRFKLSDLRFKFGRSKREYKNQSSLLKTKVILWLRSASQFALNLCGKNNFFFFNSRDLKIFFLVLPTTILKDEKKNLKKSKIIKNNFFSKNVEDKLS